MAQSSKGKNSTAKALRKPKLQSKQVETLFAGKAKFTRQKRFEISRSKHKRRKAVINYKGWEAFPSTCQYHPEGCSAST